MRIVGAPIAAILVCIVVSSATGCVSTTPMTPETAGKIKDREVVIGKRQKPDFYAFTLGGVAPAALMGALGGALSGGGVVHEGNEIVARYHVEDPAAYIGEELSAYLSSKYGTKITSRSVVITDDDVEALSKKNPGVDLILEVRTRYWDFIYLLTHLDRYKVRYRAHFRLIDVGTARVVAEGVCFRDPDQTPTAPTYDELLASNAARLKRELREAADSCIDEFETKVLHL